MRLTRHTLSAALAALLIAAPAATARPAGIHAYPAAADTSQDLRSPTATHEVPPAPSSMAAAARKHYEQLRSPGAQTQQDMRSPDARDAAEHRGTYNSPDVVIVKVPQPSPAAAEPLSAGGIDWADAGIGAGSLLGLSLVGLGGALVIVRRRRGAHGAPPVVGP